MSSSRIRPHTVGTNIDPYKLLATITCERLPTDFERPLAQERHAYILGTVRSSPGFVSPYAAGPQTSTDSTMHYATLITLYGILLKRYAREPDIQVGVIVEDERIVSIPLNGVLGLEISVAQAINMVHVLWQGRTPIDQIGTSTLALSTQALSIDIGSLGPPQEPNKRKFTIPKEWPLLCFSPSFKANRNITSDLCLTIAKEGPVFTMQYNARLFSSTMMQAMMRCWETLLTNAYQDPSVRQDFVEVVSPRDRQMLTFEWNPPQTTFAPMTGIHQLFEARVDEAPDRLALIGPLPGKEENYPQEVLELTYADLEQQANQLAHNLLALLGLPQKRQQQSLCTVAILLERSICFYVAMLGILKAGGAYLSIDPDYPDDRIRFMLEDSQTSVLITTTALATRLKDSPPLLLLDDPTYVRNLAKQPVSRPTNINLDPECLCYIIYTSGSTGKPKGVQISHLNALNLIRVEQLVYDIQPSDRILQGFSTSFDASVEEIWMAFHSGATLVVGTKEIMRSGPDFPQYIDLLGITCLSTVPTLLATIPESKEALQKVRLIITGGESCSKELVNRWAHPSSSSSSQGRRFFNTYGPTEATVIATYKECFRGTTERMSIGKPLPNYQCYIVDEHLNLLPPGALGELLIGGVSVSKRGYLNMPEKTKSVFRPDHLTGGNYNLYRSGDLARHSCTTGEIEYCGRADSQVKIRGYRIELSEVESVLCALPGIKSAVVDVQQGMGMMNHLVAFVFPMAAANNTEQLAMIDTAALLQALREKLPVFMIPSHIEVVTSFPTLPSGKVDRRRLPQVMRPASRRTFSRTLTGGASASHVLQNAASGAPTAAGGSFRNIGGEEHRESDDDEGCHDLSNFERYVAEAFESILGIPKGGITSSNADFFDMGGNSLLASMLITKLRRDYPGLTTRHVYNHTTVGSLGPILELLAGHEQQQHKEGNSSLQVSTPRTLTAPSSLVKNEHENFYVPSRATMIQADIVQFLAMYVLAAYSGMNGLAIYFIFFECNDWPILKILALLATAPIVITLTSFLLVVAAKWLILGKVKEGDYPLWQSYHLRFWFVQSLDNIFRLRHLPIFSGTPLVPFYYWVMGCKIGRDVFIDGQLEGYDLVMIGDGSILNAACNVSAVSVDGNYLRLHKVSIGKSVNLGIRANVECGASVGDYSKIETMSLVPSFSTIPSEQRWTGSPATLKSTTCAPSSPLHNLSFGIGALQVAWGLLHEAVEGAVLVVFLLIVRQLPRLALAISGGSLEIERLDNIASTASTPFLNLIWLFMVMELGSFFVNTGLVAILKRLLLLGMDDITQYPLNSLYYFRRWAADEMMNSLALYTKRLRGTLYLPWWYRLMGSKVGKHAEIATFNYVAADKLTLGDYSFIADDIVLGMPHIEEGLVHHDSVRIGHRSFVGNGSVVTSGTCLPDLTLVGVSSLAPKLSRSGETYVGNPPLKIKREGHAATSSKEKGEAVTYNPSLSMLLLRYLVEGLGFLVLHFSLAFMFALLYLATTLHYSYLYDRLYLALVPFLVIGHALLAILITLFWKWTVIGKFRPGSYALFGLYVWRTEFVERIEENVLQAIAFPLINGTVWMQRVYQAMGVKMGKRAYLDYPCFCEADLCTVGDYFNMEKEGTLQAHLFQDRVRTTAPVRVGNHCSIGSNAVVLPGGVVGDGCSLGALSMVMRSEELPPHTKWHGLPAKSLVDGDEEECI